MLRNLSIFLLVLWISPVYGTVLDFPVPTSWSAFQPILVSRLTQTKPKMKLTVQQASSFANFLTTLKDPTPALTKLQLVLPKTTLELLMAVHARGVFLEEAEKIAVYLQNLMEKFQFQNPGPFDENTSHIIGRDWPEIDYTGEGMTWEKQREKYRPHGITSFKTLENVRKFFPVESRLPYFKKIYRPKNP